MTFNRNIIQVPELFLSVFPFIWSYTKTATNAANKTNTDFTESHTSVMGQIKWKYMGKHQKEKREKN